MVVTGNLFNMLLRDMLSVMIMALTVSLPLSMYKWTYDKRIRITLDQLVEMKENEYTAGIDIWGSDIIVEEFYYISLGPDKKRNTKDDIKVFK